jgi:hypothetical protein
MIAPAKVTSLEIKPLAGTIGGTQVNWECEVGCAYTRSENAIVAYGVLQGGDHEEGMQRLAARLRREGCPGDLYFPDEEDFEPHARGHLIYIKNLSDDVVLPLEGEALRALFFAHYLNPHEVVA